MTLDSQTNEPTKMEPILNKIYFFYGFSSSKKNESDMERARQRQKKETEITVQEQINTMKIETKQAMKKIRQCAFK